jgi:hypothetical protein
MGLSHLDDLALSAIRKRALLRRFRRGDEGTIAMMLSILGRLYEIQTVSKITSDGVPQAFYLDPDEAVIQLPVTLDDRRQLHALIHAISRAINFELVRADQANNTGAFTAELADALAQVIQARELAAWESAANIYTTATGSDRRRLH